MESFFFLLLAGNFLCLKLFIAFLPSAEGFQLFQNRLWLWHKGPYPLGSIQATQKLKYLCKIVSVYFHFWDLLSENPTAGSQTIKQGPSTLKGQPDWVLALGFQHFLQARLSWLPLSLLVRVDTFSKNMA